MAVIHLDTVSAAGMKQQKGSACNKDADVKHGAEDNVPLVLEIRLAKDKRVLVARPVQIWQVRRIVPGRDAGVGGEEDKGADLVDEPVLLLGQLEGIQVWVAARQDAPHVQRHEEEEDADGEQQGDVDVHGLEAIAGELDDEAGGGCGGEKGAEESDVGQIILVKVLEDDGGQPLGVEGDADAQAVHVGASGGWA